MNELEKLARNASMLSGRAPRIQPKDNTKYEDRQQFPYLADATQEFIEQVGELASNCYGAECQGLDDKDFYKYGNVLIRTVPASNARTGEIMPDEWQSVQIVRPAKIDCLRPGAYMKFGGNTWVVYKGLNLGSVTGDGIIRRCNFVIKTLDFYGNIIEVPASFSKMGTLSNAPRTSENSIVAKNYMACVAQLNDISKNFAENTRFILGKTAYSMRGLNDFTREFTDDPESMHLLTFTIERSQPLDSDNMELGVADYNTFKWELRFRWNEQMNAGERQQIIIDSVKNGEEIQSTAERPVSYIFESKNQSVLTVDKTGTVSAIGEGKAEIEISLAQNPDIKNTIEIEVADRGETYLGFTNAAISSLREYDSCIISASVYRNGQASEEEVKFTLSGPDELCYTSKETGINSIEIKCFAASNKALRITAESGDMRAETELKLTTG